MTENLFLRNVIAVIWDFDETLIPGNMQQPIFEKYEVDANTFWDEVNGLAAYYGGKGIQVSPDTLYLNHILTYVKEGKFKGLTNAKLKELGARLQLQPGLPEFLPALKSRIQDNASFKRHEIKLEHYIVSTGLRQMILGSAIAKHVEDVWGCEFVEEPAPSGYLSGRQHLMPLADIPSGGLAPRRGKGGVERDLELSQVVYQLDNTTKTRAIFEINKGTNKDPRISVNASINPEDRRVPFHNMIYVADGPSDIPVFSILNQYGGKTFGVYGQSDKHFMQVYDLQQQERVQSFGPADYREKTHTVRWIIHSAELIASKIVESRERLVEQKVQPPPAHLPRDETVETPRVREQMTEERA